MRRLNVMTTFLPRENLFFLEEWLLYHLQIGVDHLYLYDNAGSRQIDQYENLEVTGRNKHGLPIYRLLAHLTDAEVAARTERLLAPYIAGGVVTHIPWRPVDSRGERVFNQAEAYLDYIARFATSGEWSAFVDPDEFLVSEHYPWLPGLLDDLDASDGGYIEMGQRAFAPRFNDAGQPVRFVLGITRCDPALITWGGVKAMIRSDLLIIPENYDSNIIHYPPVRPDTGVFCDTTGDVLRFNHYRYAAKPIERSAIEHGRTVTLIAEDHSMARYLPWIAAHRRSPAGLLAGQRVRPGPWRRPAPDGAPEALAAPAVTPG